MMMNESWGAVISKPAYGNRGLQISGGTNPNFQWPASSRPTVRMDGSPLVIGDKWARSTDGIIFLWTGTYWTTEQVFEAVDTTTLITGPSLFINVGNLRPEVGNVLLVSLNLGGFFATANNLSNHFVFRLGAPPINNAAPFVIESLSYEWDLNVLSGWHFRQIPLNTFVDLTTNPGHRFFSFRYERVGTTGSFFPRCSLTYRYAA